ncbi:Acyl-coenzyme A synthetases/AMP-(fatty) acid ligases [hydrothermal vent metagenome]|uniref:Acyl-coenzyme A synthetases/AMP-(Fatty) acid ligases n=1 Tax=hydrothermal vent metagenome TaxID=652676 RepID=A0A3B1B940_9ZZZZ
MSDLTAYVDQFAADNLPDENDLPEFIHDFSELQYPRRLNAACQLLDKNIAAGRGDKIAIRTPDESWTYREVFEKSNQIAHVLVEDMGLVTGNRVLLRSANNPMMVACWFAVLKAGGIAVATMPLLRTRDLIPVITKAEVSLGLCDARLAEELENAKAAAPFLKQLYYFNGRDDKLDNLMKDKPVDFEPVDTAAKDIALIAFTSGTTGNPKGTMHYHQDVMSMCNCVGDRLLGIGEDDVIIGSPPLAFTFGLGALLAFPFYAGASTVLLEMGTPEVYLKSIERFRATWSFTAPTAYRAMLTSAADHDLSCLRACVSAGEHLPLPTFKAWEAATGLRLIDGIGATEMIHIFISAAGEDIRPGATGKAIAGYQACILDQDYKPLPAGKVGRLAVKGPTGCKYLNDDRQSVYVQGGWNVTGDAYKMDEYGYFWFQARDDDMIVSSGYNIGGPEVEEALMDHPAVAECAVVAAPDAARGQIVKAFILLASGYEAGDDLIKELQAFVKQAIAPYKYPRAIAFVEDLPKTETGKVQRFLLRQRELEKS